MLFPPDKQVIRVERGRYGELIDKLGGNVALNLRRISSSMQKDRSSRLFFLLNPKQIAATEARSMFGEKDGVRLITFPFEAGYVPFLDLRGLDEGEAVAKIRVTSSPSSMILLTYATSASSLKEAFATLTGKKFSLEHSLRLLERVIGKNKSVFKHMETGKFCVICGDYVVSPTETGVSLRCEDNHHYVKSSVYRISDSIMLAWEEGIILEGYVARLLEADGWDTVIGGEVIGTRGSRHEIDVMAERNDNYLIVECKHLAPYNEIPYDDVMVTFGKMTVVERTLRAVYKRRRRRLGRIIKAFVTTGKLTEVKMLRGALLETPEFLIAERDDLVRGLRDFRKKLQEAVTTGSK
ncbi:MAG: hypothetical protein ACE5OY_01355 [Candidatus Bathyarchaeia archaeon]